MNANLERCSRWLVVASCIPAILAAAGWKLFWNHTPSMPAGLYVGRKNAQVEKGALALVRPPPEALKLGCVHRGTYLLKQIRGTAGDEVCISADRQVLVEGEPCGDIPRESLTGAPLEPAFWGCRRVPEDTVFVVGEHRRSCDSRLLGFINKSNIWGSAYLLFASKGEP